MGADNSTAIKFWEKHHEVFISVALWHPKMGHWCGYLGRTDGVEIPQETYYHWDGAVGGMNTSEIPEIGVSIRVSGFDTAHANDTNLGPNGEIGLSYYKPGPFPEKVWTKEKIFEHLREVADKVLLDEMTPSA